MPSPVDIELEVLIRARYPIIYVVSWEERRVEEALRGISTRRGKKLFMWTVTQGMVLNSSAEDDATRGPMTALDFIMHSNEPAIFVLKDFHPYMNEDTVARRLRDLTGRLTTTYKTLVILSPLLKLPPELEKDVTVIDYSLPSLEDLDELLEVVAQSARGNAQYNTDLSDEEREQVLKAAQGLTATEASNVFAKSLVEKHRFDVDVILSEKQQIIRKSGTLEYFPADDSFADIGGMDVLKGWMKKRNQAFTEKARAFGLPQPKGILLLGVQGCGKSLACKAVASLWRFPLLRLDVGKIFSGIIGSSEENVRRAISTAESISPAILWLDELEKGFAGVQSSPFSDAGVTSRVFASFITWLQEKTAPVFVVATANDVSNLPPELMRKGRFDEIFFVDLPSTSEREEIFAIHLRRRKRDPRKYELRKLAELSAGFSGAEIEQAVVSGLYDAFDASRDLLQEDLEKSITESIPLSKTMKEQIAELRKWASTRARPSSSQTAEEISDQENG